MLSAPVRRLVLTNPEFHAIFTARMAGAIADGIEVALMPLEPALQAKVDETTLAASREMAPLAAEALAVAAEDLNDT